MEMITTIFFAVVMAALDMWPSRQTLRRYPVSSGRRILSQLIVALLFCLLLLLVVDDVMLPSWEIWISVSSSSSSSSADGATYCNCKPVAGGKSSGHRATRFSPMILQTIQKKADDELVLRGANLPQLRCQSDLCDVSGSANRG